MAIAKKIRNMIVEAVRKIGGGSFGAKICSLQRLQMLSIQPISGIDDEHDEYVAVTQDRKAAKVVISLFELSYRLPILKLMIGYLCVDEWRNLEVALGNHNEMRREYSEALSTVAEIYLSNSKSRKHQVEWIGNELLNWVLSKKIRIISWYSCSFPDEHFHTILNAINRSVSPVLHTIKFVSSNVTNSQLQTILGGKLPTCLRSLTINSCYLITNKIFRGLGRLQFPVLTSLALTFCNNVTDDGLIQISRWYMPLLQSLDISGLKISDTGLLALAENAATFAPKLQSLQRSRDNNNITNVGVSAIRQSFPALQTVYIRGPQQKVTVEWSR